MEDLLTILWNNDSRLDALVIPISSRGNVVAISRALLHGPNTVVTKLTLMLSDESEEVDTDALMDYIMSSCSLKTIMVSGKATRSTNHILFSIARNPAIRECILYDLNIDIDAMTGFLKNLAENNALKELRILSCDFVATSLSTSFEVLRHAFATVATKFSLQTLSLEGDRDNLGILKGVTNYQDLTVVAIVNLFQAGNTDVTKDMGIINDFLEQSRSIQHLVLRGRSILTVNDSQQQLLHQKLEFLHALKRNSSIKIIDCAAYTESLTEIEMVGIKNVCTRNIKLHQIIKSCCSQEQLEERHGLGHRGRQDVDSNNIHNQNRERNQVLMVDQKWWPHILRQAAFCKNHDAIYLTLITLEAI